MPQVAPAFVFDVEGTTGRVDQSGKVGRRCGAEGIAFLDRGDAQGTQVV
jgi:hypothetical protein